MKYVIPSILLALVAGTTVFAKGGQKQPALSTANHSSVQFIENKGQVTDQHGKVRKDIDMKIEANGVVMFVGDGGWHYQWVRSSESKVAGRKSGAGGPAFAEATAGEAGDNTASSVEIYRMDVKLVGANKHAEVIFEEPTGYYENYYLAHTGEDGVTVKGYQRVVYKNVYPNIDLVFYTERVSGASIPPPSAKLTPPPAGDNTLSLFPAACPDQFGSGGDEVRAGDGIFRGASGPAFAEASAGNVKYDFIIRPGGNPADIRLQYEGAAELKLVGGPALAGSSGRALVATTPYGSITEAAPYCYQAESGEEVVSAFKLSGNTLSFDIGSYTGTLVVDPTLHWATYYGGSGVEGATCVATDFAGNVYLGGNSGSLNMATTGAFKTTVTGIGDNLLVKFNTEGQRIWATYYGGDSTENIQGIGIDFFGDVIIGGVTLSCSGIATQGAFRDTCFPTVRSNGHYEGFLAKFTSNGEMLWATYYGGEKGAQILDIAIDKNGNICLAGFTQSITGMATLGPTYTTNFSQYHAFIAKFNRNGQRLWGRYNTSVEWQNLYGLVCDDSMNIYVVGPIHNSTGGFATTGSHQSTFGGATDGGIVKYSSSGALIWSTYYGGPGSDYLYDVVCDHEGGIYAAGYTGSSTGIATINGSQNTLNGSRDGFVVKLNASGQRVWGTYIGGSGSDEIHDISYNNLGKIYINGITSSLSGIATSDAFQSYHAGKEDFWYAELDTAGSLTWSTYYGGGGRDLNHWGASIANGVDGKVYFCGSTDTSTGLATANSFQDTITDQGEAVLVSVLIDTAVYIPLPSIDTSLCAGDTIRVPYKVSYHFRNGNNFTIQLSDSNGSFTNPVSIGTYAATTSDTIICIIPANTYNGKNYKLRVSGSNPARISADNGFRFRISQYPAQPAITVDTLLCAEDSLHLSAADGGAGVTYAWTGPNGFTSASKDTTIVNVGVAASGLYSVIASRAACSSMDTQTIQVKHLPKTPLAGSNSPVCENDTLKLNADSITTLAVYTWTGPGNFTTNAIDTSIAAAVPSMSGDYIIEADLNGCVEKDTVAVTVKPLPAAAPPSNNSPVCGGDTLHLYSGVSTSGTVYAWSGPGGFSATVQDTALVNPVPSQTGWYKLQLSLNGCSRQDSTYAIVTPIPVIHNTAYNQPLCVGETLSLQTGNITGATFAWQGPGSFSSVQQNPTRANMQFSDTGWYYVSAMVNTCASNTDSVRVVLNPLPFVAISASPGNSICQGQPVQFTAYPNNHGGTPDYQWYVNGIATGGNSTLFSSTALNNGDIVRCDMTEETKCSSPATDQSNDISMTVRSWLAPNVTITADAGPSLFPNEPINFTAVATDAGAGPKYQWKRNGMNVVGATGAVWGANANFLSDGDEICVLVTSTYECPQPDTALSNCIKLQIRVGVDDVAGNSNGFRIYPNPVKTSLYLSPRDRGLNNSLSVEIIDIYGRSVRRELLAARGKGRPAAFGRGETIDVDVRSLVPGVYIIRVDGVVVGRVVKE